MKSSSGTSSIYASHYLPLVKPFVPGRRRTLLTAREEAPGWQISVDFERA